MEDRTEEDPHRGRQGLDGGFRGCRGSVTTTAAGHQPKSDGDTDETMHEAAANGWWRPVEREILKRERRSGIAEGASGRVMLSSYGPSGVACSDRSEPRPSP